MRLIHSMSASLSSLSVSNTSRFARRRSGFIIGGQFFLYDVFKGVVGIGAVETAVETLEVVKEFEAVL